MSSTTDCVDGALLDDSVLLYVDDILIYSDSVESNEAEIKDQQI